MCAIAHNIAPVKYQNSVRVADGAEAVRHNESGAPLGQFIQFLLEVHMSSLVPERSDNDTGSRMIAVDDTDAAIVQGQALMNAFTDSDLTYILQQSFTVEDFDTRDLDAPARTAF